MGHGQDTELVRGCPLGCAEPGVPLGALRTTMTVALSRSDYTLARCGCGKLLYLSPAPTAADLRAMYVDANQFGEEYTDAARTRSIVGYMSEALARIAASREWPAARPLRVLEVGAGLAWMCRAAKLRNDRSTTVAQDVSPEAASRCAWVDEYVQGGIEDARLERRAPYDVVSLTHVIEHLVDPVAALRQCTALLARDGVVFVTAPFRPRGWNDDAPDLAAWRAYSYNHVPAHIQYFSEGSMQRLAAALGVTLAHWSDRHDGGQAFEAWLVRRDARGSLPTWGGRLRGLLNGVAARRRARKIY